VGQSVAEPAESDSQLTHHDIPTSQNDTNTYFFHISIPVQSRNIPLRQNSAVNSAMTSKTPSSHGPLLSRFACFTAPPSRIGLLVGLFIHLCDSHHEITKMQKEEKEQHQRTEVNCTLMRI